MSKKVMGQNGVGKSSLEMKMGELHIGRVIQDVLVEKGMSKAEFGRRSGTSRQNVNALLLKPHVDTEQLIRISLALDRNLFAVYYHALGGGEGLDAYSQSLLIRDALELGQLQARFISKLMALANAQGLNQVS